MPALLEGRLRAARRNAFVGREAERALVATALAAEVLPFCVLHVHGPGGVGKTSLLKMFGDAAAETGNLAVYADARNLDPSPAGFVTVLRLMFASADPTAWKDRPLSIDVEQFWRDVSACAAGRRVVLLLDTVETLAPLDDWLRDVFLPPMPETVLVVLAGRQPPSAAWRADPGWQTLIRALALRNLGPDEGRAYLSQRRIPIDQHAQVLAFTHGHPLALSLVADTFAQRTEAHTFLPEESPDLIRTLLEKFVQKVPGPAHRAALEASALVRSMTESLLASMLNMPDPALGAAEGVRELFDWLRSLSFVDSAPGGLLLHDLARDAMSADVRWRNPEWYTQLHNRARAYYNAGMKRSQGLEQQRFLSDIIFLHRDNAVVRPFIDWQQQGGLFVDHARPADLPALLAMVERHEGAPSAAIARHWFERQPQGISVVRDTQQQPRGFALRLSMRDVDEADCAIDPAMQPARDWMARTIGLRPAEVGLHFRFWMAHDTYQAVSPIQSLIFLNVVQHYLVTPRLACHVFPAAAPEFWMPVLSYAELQRTPECDFAVAGRAYGAFTHNWRAMPPTLWLEILAQKEVGATPTPSASDGPATAALSEVEFAEGARDALRDFNRPQALRANRLLNARLVIDRSGPNAAEMDRVSALKALVQQAIDALNSGPRDAKLYRALVHTYIKPAATQEKAAELLDVPFSTYRRHLQAGVARVVEMLWARELGG